MNDQPIEPSPSVDVPSEATTAAEPAAEVVLTADEIQEQMANTRRQIHERSDEVVAQTQELTDWRFYVKRYPWFSVTNRHQWGAVVWYNGQQAISPTCELGVIDRIGGGDGFASGLIYGMLDGRELDEVVRLGWAHGALSTTFPGDVTMARLPEVETFAKGGSARVQR